MARTRRLVLTLGTLALLAGSARAHGAALSGSAGSVAIPTWLFLTTGGLVVGASFLLATFATDRALVRRAHDRTYSVWSIPPLLERWVAPAFGLLGLVAVLVFGYGAAFDLAPMDPKRNLAVLIVWVAWWAGYVITLYTLGNTWPVIDPFRTIASGLPSLDRPYPTRVGAWPAVVGLLALVFVEVTLPLAENPIVLAGAVTAYGALTVAGAVVYGAEDWFSTADPVARAFDHYGRVAPIGRGADGLELGLPGAGLVPEDRCRTDESATTDTTLARARPDVGSRGGVPFVVALVFATTYDGFVATPGWRTIATAVHDAFPVPGLAIYAIVFVVGFAVFLAVYRLAARAGRRTGETFVTVDALAGLFAPPLLAIAAGYHLAHYLGFFVSLSLPLGTALAAPLNPPDAVVFEVPGIVGGLGVTAILLAHLLAIWVAHAVGFETFPERLQAIRAQYTFVAVMIAYTMLSLWIVTQPTVTPPFL